VRIESGGIDGGKNNDFNAASAGLIQVNQPPTERWKIIPQNFREGEFAMWISSLRYDLWPSPKRASSPTPVHVAGTRTKRFRDRGPNAIPPHERLLLVVLLLVVAGWIILRLVLTLLAAH